MSSLSIPPLTSAEALAAFRAAGLAPGDHVAIGVSGGADSVALALLAHDHLKVSTFTVDHGLRRDSADEADTVSALMAQYGIPHIILPWAGVKPEANIQATARAARYRLLAEACTDAGLSTLLLAHHRGDQAETLVMRLMRGSGLKGLAGIRQRQPLPGTAVTLVRPLLDIPKARLIATLAARDVDWIEDPSNSDPRYDRVRVRRLLEGVDTPDLVEQRLAAAAQSLARADVAIDHFVNQLIQKAVSPQAGEWLQLNCEEIYGGAWPDEVRLRFWSHLVRLVGGHEHTPPFEAIHRIDRAFQACGVHASETLAGVRVMSVSGAALCMVREAGRMDQRALAPGRVRVEEPGLWQLELDVPREGLTLGPLGEEGWSSLKGALDPCGDFLAWPLAVKAASPAVFDGSAVLAAPLMGYARQGTGLEIIKAEGRLATQFSS